MFTDSKIRSVLNLKRIIKYSIKNRVTLIGAPDGRERGHHDALPAEHFDRVCDSFDRPVYYHVSSQVDENFSPKNRHQPRYIISSVEVSIVVRARRRCTFRFPRVRRSC